MALFARKSRLVEKALGSTRKRITEATSYVDIGYNIVFVYNPLLDVAFHTATKPV